MRGEPHSGFHVHTFRHVAYYRAQVNSCANRQIAPFPPPTGGEGRGEGVNG